MNSYVTTDLRIFLFDDGESHWVLAENEEQARNFFENEYADKEVLLNNAKENESKNISDGYEVKEIPKDSEDTICNIAEDEELYKMVNKYKPKNKWVNELNVWQFVKYALLVDEIRYGEATVPTCFACSVC